MTQHSPSAWDLSSLLDYCKDGECQAGVKIAGILQYVPARPMKNLDTLPERLRLAWAVFQKAALTPCFGRDSRP